MRTRLPIFSIVALPFLALPTLLQPIATAALEQPTPKIGGHIEDGEALVNGEMGNSESDPASQPNDHRPADDIPALTADEEADPVSDSYKSAVPCKQVFLGKVANSPLSPMMPPSMTVRSLLIHRVDRTKTPAALPRHETCCI